MHYYGHGSWVALVVLAGVILIRIISSQRRRGERPGAGSSSQFTAFRPGPPTPPERRDVPPPEPPAGGASTGSATGTGVDPGWFPDPTGRHGQRYWSGKEWTEHVLDDGVPGTDPPPRPPRQPD